MLYPPTAKGDFKMSISKLLVTCLLFGLLSTQATRAEIINDSQGDAADTFGAGGPLLDISFLSYSVIATDLEVTLGFYTPIAAPSAALVNSVVGEIGFDTDQNPATGTFPIQNVYAPPFTSVALGIDFIADLFSEDITPGFIDILDQNLSTVGSVPITYLPNSLSFLVPLAMLGGDDGVMDITAAIGTFDQPTDALHDVPAPAPLWLIGLASLALLKRPRA